MRTKTLLLTTVLGIVGASAAMAQTNVYSANAVGYVNITIPVGFAIIANQLDNNGTNTLAALLPDAPDGTTIYKFNGTGYDIATHDGDWGAKGSTTLNPGEGAFIKVITSPLTLTFVGNVMSGTLTNSIPAGFSIRSSMVPQQGVLDTDLKFPAVDGDTIYRYDTTAKGYIVATSDGGLPAAKATVNVGEGFFVKKNVAANWVRTFDPNNP